MLTIAQMVDRLSHYVEEQGFIYTDQYEQLVLSCGFTHAASIAAAALEELKDSPNQVLVKERN